MSLVLQPGPLLVLGALAGIMLLGAWRLRTRPMRLTSRVADAADAAIITGAAREVTLADIQAQIAAVEAASQERFHRMRAWVFWVPMLWALIGAVYWMLAVLMER